MEKHIVIKKNIYILISPSPKVELKLVLTVVVDLNCRCASLEMCTLQCSESPSELPEGEIE